MSLLISCEVGGNEVPEQLIDPALRDVLQFINISTATRRPTLRMLSSIIIVEPLWVSEAGKIVAKKHVPESCLQHSHDEPAAYVAQRLADKLQVRLS